MAEQATCSSLHHSEKKGLIHSYNGLKTRPFAEIKCQRSRDQVPKKPRSSAKEADLLLLQ
jgi:hypothetical protein